MNNISLKISTEASMNFLKTDLPAAYDLFLFLSCFPDGLSKHYVVKLMGNEADIENSLEELESLAFLEKSSEKIKLTPFVVTFIQTSLDDETKGEWMNTICSFYNDFLQNMYTVFKAVEQDNTKMLTAVKEVASSDEEDSPRNAGQENSDKLAAKSTSLTVR
jgi:hypothetical protein